MEVSVYKFECCDFEQTVDSNEVFDIDTDREPCVATYCGICDFMVNLGYEKRKVNNE